MVSSYHGCSIIAGKRSAPVGHGFTIHSPVTAKELPGEFYTASPEDIDLALNKASEAFSTFRSTSGETRAVFLEAIATHLDASATELLDRAHLETGLPLDRLRAELDRTLLQLRMFADIARKDSWLDLRHEPALPDRRPTPRPDLRRAYRPIGPVIVFGSSNFPLAYSVAGGDTASAFATGNPVVVKAHEAHPGTSERVAEAIVSAADIACLPPGIFSLLQGSGRDIGVPMVMHPATRAVGFTGSTHAGRILIDAAAKRPDPIPVFAEMGSINPVLILPSALGNGNESAHIAESIIHAITNNAGQFCTKPGVILIPEGTCGHQLIAQMSEKVRLTSPVPMLHRGIHTAFHEGAAKLQHQRGLSTIACKEAAPDTLEGTIFLLQTDAQIFLTNERLSQEYFGPLCIVVTWSTTDEIRQIFRLLHGQLTASLFADEDDPTALTHLPLLEDSAGRIILNGVPTGVEVNSAIQHGGPWPASSDPRFSAVGPAALLRFVRPIAYQNFSSALLPSFFH